MSRFKKKYKVSAPVNIDKVRKKLDDDTDFDNQNVDGMSAVEQLADMSRAESYNANQTASTAKFESKEALIQAANALQYNMGKWLSPPAENFDSISELHPEAITNDRVFTRDTGKAYRKDIDGEWKEFAEIAISPLSEIDARLSRKIGNIHVDITDFGATAGGIVDCYQAFKEAFDYLKSQGGGTLFVPAGSYYISRRILEMIDFPLFINAKGAVLIRKYVDETVENDPHMRLMGVLSNSIPITANMSVYGRRIKVQSTSALKENQVIKIETDEVYTYRSGDTNSAYYKGWMTRITEIVDSTTIEVADLIPYNYDSTFNLKIKVVKWNKFKLDGLSCEWDGVVSSGEAKLTTGIDIQNAANVDMMDVDSSNTTRSGVALSHLYNAYFRNVASDTSKAANELNYGVIMSGIHHSLFMDSMGTAQRHPIALTGTPCVGLIFKNIRPASRGRQSGVCFDAHIAEKVTVIDSVLVHGINIAGGHYLFTNCELSNGTKTSNIFRRRSASFHKSLTIDNCEIFALTNDEGTGVYLYNVSPQDHLENYGDFTMKDSKVRGSAATVNLFGMVNAQIIPTRVGLFTIENCDFYIRTNEIIQTGVFPSGRAPERGILEIRRSRFRDHTFNVAHNLFREASYLYCKPIVQSSDTLRYVKDDTENCRIDVVDNIFTNAIVARNNSGRLRVDKNEVLDSTQGGIGANLLTNNANLILKWNIVYAASGGATKGFDVNGSNSIKIGNVFISDDNEANVYR